MTEKLTNINALSTDVSLASLSSKSKAQREILSELKESNHDAAHSALINAISATFDSLLRNHSERMRIQNELFEQHMKDL